MTLKLVEEYVDIFKLPPIDNDHLGVIGEEITTGDLHGSFLRLLFLFYKHGIVTNHNDEQYEKFVSLYKKNAEDLNQGDLDSFKDLIAQMNFSNTAKIRLIGDVLADRGPNDLFTLLILQAARNQGVNIEIIFSNHDIDFILACENNTPFDKTPLGFQANSLQNVQVLIN